MIQGIQVLGIIFALCMMYLIFLNFKRKEIRPAEFLFWCGAWVLFVVLILYPQVTSPLLQSLHIVRALDLFIIIAFMFLIAFHFVTYHLVRKTQRKMEQLVRNLAVREYEEKKRK